MDSGVASRWLKCVETGVSLMNHHQLIRFRQIKKNPEEIFKQVDVLKSYLFHRRLLIKIYHCAIILHSSYMAYVNRIEFVFVNTYQKFVVTNYIAEPFHRIFLGFFSNTRNAILVNEWKIFV